MRMTTRIWILVIQGILILVSSIFFPVANHLEITPGWGINPGEQVVVSILSVIFIALFPLPFALHDLQSAISEKILFSDKKAADLKAQDDHDFLLLELQKNIKGINSIEDGNLFYSYLYNDLERITGLSNTMRHNRRFSDVPTIATAKHLLSGITSKDLCRHVHFLDNNDHFFENTHSVDINCEFDRLRNSHSLAEFCRLLVYTDPQQLLDYRTLLLFLYHYDGQRLNCRVISELNYVEKQSDPNFSRTLGDSRLDFGLYGDDYVYHSQQTPDDINAPYGTYICDKSIVEKYASFFDHCWGSQRALELPELYMNKIRNVLEISYKRNNGCPRNTSIQNVQELITIENTIGENFKDVVSESKLPRLG